MAKYPVRQQKVVNALRKLYGAYVANTVNGVAKLRSNSDPQALHTVSPDGTWYIDGDRIPNVDTERLLDRAKRPLPLPGLPR